MGKRAEVPNILIFMVDQMQRDVTLPGHPCHMPNVRRLAEQGVSFTQTFTCSPHCCPSRATFMTGLYPSRHGVFNNVETNTAFQKGLNPGVRTFSEFLSHAGYRLACAGKYHVTNLETPAERKWEEITKYRKNFEHPRNEDWDAEALHPPPPDETRRRGTIWRPGWVDSSVICSKTEYEATYWYRNAVRPGIEEIPRLAKSGKPWTLFISSDMNPGEAVPAELLDLYDPREIPLPASFNDTLSDKPRIYQRMRRQLWDQLTEEEAREVLAGYWALCSLQDRYLGDILAALDASGQAENTLVVLVSDHGEFGFAHGLLEIGIPSFREVYHVPAILRWPRGIHAPGRTVDEFVSLADFAPTFLELAGCAADVRFTGRSLAPFLRGEKPDAWPDAWYSQTKGNEVYYTQRIVQTRDYKYVCNWFDFDEMYDLRADPHELVNIAFPKDLLPSRGTGETTRGRYTPWPHLPPEVESVRQGLLARMWQFARREEDIIFNGYLPVALAPYGPLVGLTDKAERINDKDE